MITAVFDTNVLASGLTIRGGVPDRLLRAWLSDQFELVVSEHILTELERTFHKPYFRARLTSRQIARNLALLRRRASIVTVTAVVQGVATQPEDDWVLAAAVSFQADYLVTGDKKLQQLGAYQGVAIMSPRAFLAILTGPAP